MVWQREGPLKLGDGETVMFRERYLVGRCAGGEPSREGWDDQEKALVDDLRWWSLVDLAACAEVIYPRELPALAGEIAAGTYPLEPLTLSWA